MSRLETVEQDLVAQPRSWLVTGAAGFIGSNLVERLLNLDQRVTGLDNFATGHLRNLDDVRTAVTAQQWGRFRFIEGDIRELGSCQEATKGADYVLHQAALGSVPRSIEDPIRTNQANIDGFLNMLVAARDSGVKRFVYAASSSTYGDDPDLPKVEHKIGKPLSPYAVTKLVNELYADVFARTYAVQSIGLRYFNVFGARQDPHGGYAAVIPTWVSAMLRGGTVFINGDGETSRDFCYVANAVQANILAATVDDPEAFNQVYNIAVGERTTLNDLYRMLQAELQRRVPDLTVMAAQHRDVRVGDVRHSLADIGKARRLLGYAPTHTLIKGVGESMGFYVADYAVQAAGQ